MQFSGLHVKVWILQVQDEALNLTFIFYRLPEPQFEKYCNKVQHGIVQYILIQRSLVLCKITSYQIIKILYTYYKQFAFISLLERVFYFYSFLNECFQRFKLHIYQRTFRVSTQIRAMANTSAILWPIGFLLKKSLKCLAERGGSPL